MYLRNPRKKSRIFFKIKRKIEKRVVYRSIGVNIKIDFFSYDIYNMIKEVLSYKNDHDH